MASCSDDISSEKKATMSGDGPQRAVDLLCGERLIRSSMLMLVASSSSPCLVSAMVLRSVREKPTTSHQDPRARWRARSSIEAEIGSAGHVDGVVRCDLNTSKPPWSFFGHLVKLQALLDLVLRSPMNSIVKSSLSMSSSNLDRHRARDDTFAHMMKMMAGVGFRSRPSRAQQIAEGRASQEGRS